MSAEIEETPVEETEEPTAEEVEVAEEQSLEEFNQHIKSLVALFVNEEIQELRQQVTDLELLVGQPSGAVDYRPSAIPGPQVGDVPEYFSQTLDEGSTPWYKP